MFNFLNTRWDRHLTLISARVPLLAPRTDGIPILMYHSISEPANETRHPYYWTVTSPARFRQHMQLLKDEGYEVLTLSQALVRQGQPTAQRSSRIAVITFDDGFRDFYTAAFPILTEFGFRATVFLATAYLDGMFVNGQECLQAQEVCRLAASGIEFGSHTVTHPQLQQVAPVKLQQELRESRNAIEDLLGRPATLFSYPYKFPEQDRLFVQRLATALENAGYSAGVTTSIGRASWSDPPMFLKRLPANDADDRAFLAAKMAGNYDWLHKGQLIHKKLRARFQAQRPAHT